MGVSGNSPVILSVGLGGPTILTNRKEKKGRKMKHSISPALNLEDIYALAYEDSNDDLLSHLGDKDIIHYRTKTIKSGNIIECEIYPIWSTSQSSRVQKAKESREAQKKLNEKNAVKKVIRLLNANFTDNDIWGTFTYEPAKRPNTIEEAQKEMSKFIRRLKYQCTKLGYDPLKYVYVTEVVDDEEKNKHHVHHHIVMNFPDRDLAESLWKNGARTQTRRLQADESGYEGMARYIMKAPQGSKRYVCSRNLIQPKITIADYKFSRARVNKLINNEISPSEVFEGMYEGYEFIEMKTMLSDYVSGAYVYAKLSAKKQRRIYSSGKQYPTTEQA